MKFVRRMLAVLVAGFGPTSTRAAPPLEKRIQAEWQLPVYLNKDAATLVIARTTPDMAPMRFEVRFAGRTDGASPAGPLAVLLPKGKTRAEVCVPIADWPDGEYLSTIREPGDESGRLVRVLRKQTVPRPEPPPEPIDLRGRTVLFVDDWYVSERRGLTRRVHPVETYPITSGMLGKDRPYQNAKEMFFDTDGSAVVRFYTMDRRHRNHTWFTARSRDFVHWDIKPSGARAAETGGLACSRVRVPWRWHDPQGGKALYRLYEPAADGPVDLRRVHVQYSGWASKPKRWGSVAITPRSTYPIWRKSETEYVVLTRAPLTTDKHRFADEDPGDWIDSNDNWGGQWLLPDAKCLYFCQARVVPRHPPFRVPYDNISGNRILVSWRTSDGLHWRPNWFATPDEHDPVGLQFYGASGFWVENRRLRLAYLWVYDQLRQQVYIELAYSRNSLLWHRFPGHPKLVGNGPIGAWNFGLVAPYTAPPLERGNYVYRLLRGLNRPHFFLWNGLGPKPVDAEFLEKRLGGSRRLQTWPHWKDFGSWKTLAEHLNSGSFTIGLMRHRRNGWVSFDAGTQTGTLVTKVLRAGRTLRINARTHANGSIRIEVLDADGTDIPAYCGVDSATFAGDSTDRLVSWRNGKLTRLPETPVRIRLGLQNAEVFSLQF